MGARGVGGRFGLNDLLPHATAGDEAAERRRRRAADMAIGRARLAMRLGLPMDALQSSSSSSEFDGLVELEVQRMHGSTVRGGEGDGGGVLHEDEDEDGEAAAGRRQRQGTG